VFFKSFLDALWENKFKFMKLFDIYLTIGVFYSLQYRHVAGISSQGQISTVFKAFA